jgi:hypothetical protein
MTSTLQRRLDLPIDSRCTLAPINVAKSCLGCLAEDVQALVDDGTLPWAWDISTTWTVKGTHRRETRIWVRCLLEYKEQRNCKTLSSLQPSFVLAQIIGHSRDQLRGTEIAQLWNCDWIVVHRHIKSGALDVAPGALRPKQTPRVTRASFEQFMQSRRLL